MKPLRTFDWVRAFNETAIAQFLYTKAMAALLIQDYASFVKLRRSYNVQLVQFMRGK